MLLIEDDRDDYLLTRDALAEAPGGAYKLDWISDYDAGVEALSRCEHDVCLLDYRLGAKSGLDLLRTPAAAQCRSAFIMLTGQDDLELDRAAAEAGAADFIEKSRISGASLGRAIRYAVRSQRIQDDLEQRVADRTVDLRNVNEELLVSSVRQHELTEQAEKAEAATSVSEERYRALFESAPMAIFVCDRDAVIQHYNSIAAELWGREPVCGVDRHCGSMKLWLPDGKHLPHSQSPMVEVLRTGIPAHNVEVFIERPDGSRLPVLVNFAALKNGAGEITGSITSFVDITERKQAEERLRESEDRYRTLFTSMDEGYCIIELIFDEHEKPIDYRFLEVNASFEKQSGMHDVVGKRMLEFVPSIEEHWLANYGHAAMTGEPIRFSNEYKTLNRWFDVYAFKVGETDERRVAVLFTDITGRMQAEEAMRESEERFRMMSDNIPQLAWIADAGTDGKVYWFNKSWLDYTGATLEEMQGSGWQLVHHPEHAARVIEKFERHVRESRDWEDTFPLRGRDGEYRWFLSRMNCIRDQSGKVVRIFGTNTDITESREAEIALIQSRERLVMAQEAGNVGIWDWDIRANETYWSETMWHIYGLEPNGHGPRDEEWSKLLHGNDRVEVTAAMQKALSSPSASFRDEFRIIRPDGRIRWIEAIAQVLRSTGGEPIRMYGVNIDITRRKEGEEKLRISENQLRLVTDTIPALISYIDSGGHYRFVNKKYTEWFGLEKEEILGKTIEEIAGAEAFAAVKPNVEAVLAGRELVFETKLNYTQIGERYVRVSYYPDRGIDERVNGFYALISDMTDLKRSQDLLRASEDRLILMMESVTDYAMLGMDPKCRIESWNRGAEKIFGYSREEVAGSSCDLIFTPEDRAAEIPEKEMERALKDGRASDERWYLKKDGSQFFASGAMMPMFVGGELTGYVKVLGDLTEKKRQADALIRANDELEARVEERTRELGATNLALHNEMKERAIAEAERISLLGRLVTGQEVERRRIARDLHDQLGQRLTALRLTLASLRADVADHPKFEGPVERVQEIATRLDSEVSFLAWELRPSVLDDLGLVEAIGTFLREWSLHYDTPSAFHAAEGGRVRLSPDAETHLYRITQEALNNITKHAEASHVTVQLERRDDNVILLIEDDGRGFDTAAIASSDSESGLGLVGMTERAALIGGQVEIETAPGEGTTIYVRVPVDGLPAEK